MINSIQIEDFENNQPENLTPDIDIKEQGKDEIAKCDCCFGKVTLFLIHNGYVLCNSCIENQEGMSKDELVEMIKKQSK